MTLRTLSLSLQGKNNSSKNFASKWIMILMIRAYFLDIVVYNFNSIS